MMRLLIALVALAAALHPAPAAPVPTHLFPKDPPFYYPTRKGASWVYREGEVESRFVVTAVEKGKSADAVLVSVDEVTKGKQRPYRKMDVSPGGLFWVETVGTAFDTPLCLLRCPVRAKEEWAVRTSGPGNIATTEGTMRVVGIEDIKVPAGTFSAVRVEEVYSLNGGGQKLSHTFWFAPDVGLVQADYGRGLMVLQAFSPGKE